LKKKIAEYEEIKRQIAVLAEEVEKNGLRGMGKGNYLPEVLMLTGVLGLFLTVFLAFFVEYIFRYSSRSTE